jgi:hypothetical protein
MNKIKLPSMVEYVITQWSINLTAKQRENIKKFADFLSQEPNIGMFVPAVFEDGELRILTQPTYSTNHSDDCYCDNCEKETKRCSELQKQYETVLNNVIFEGFELNQKDTSKLENIICITLGKIQLTFFLKNKALFLDNLENNYTTKINTIEQLIPYNLTLTSKFAKEFGLI